jgi:hypothetical protein
MADYSGSIDMTVPKPRKRNTGSKRLRSERRNQNRLLPNNTEQIPKKSANHW